VRELVQYKLSVRYLVVKPACVNAALDKVVIKSLVEIYRKLASKQMLSRLDDSTKIHKIQKTRIVNFGIPNLFLEMYLYLFDITLHYIEQSYK